MNEHLPMKSRQPRYNPTIHLLIGICFFSVVVSCKRTDFEFPEGNIDLVKIYDDSSASGENGNIKITAGQNRLYMTYGLGSSFYTYTNGLITQGSNELAGKLMATDLQGNRLWLNSLMSGISVTSPFEMSNGDVMVCGANLWTYNNRINSKNIYTFRFNASGAELAKDSMELPSEFGDGYILTFMDILPIDNQHILIYGSSNDFMNNSYDGFSIVYNITNGNKTIKKLSYRLNTSGGPGTTIINNCIKTKDGGYLFLGLASGDTILGNPDFTKVVLIKTNTNFDTTWTKRYDYFKAPFYQNTPFAGNVIEMPNGGFRFCMNENTEFDYKRYRAFIYDVSAKGDSLHAFTIEGFYNHYCPVLQNDANGNTVALVTEYPSMLLPSFNGIFTQINSAVYVFDDQLSLKYIKPIQTERSDFYTAVCTTTDQKMALFGLVANKVATRYTPGLLLLNF